MFGQPQPGSVSIQPKLLDYLVYTHEEVFTSIKSQSLLHLKLFFHCDFNAVKALSGARKTPYEHMWLLSYSLEVRQIHLGL